MKRVAAILAPALVACSARTTDPDVPSARRPEAKPSPIAVEGEHDDPARDPADAGATPLPDVAPSAGRGNGADEPRPEIVDVAVPGDRIVRVVHGRPDDRRVVVYLPGRCGDDLAVRFFPHAARSHGTFIALRGDIACDAPGRFKWGFDIEGVDRRIARAIAAVAATRSAPLDGELVLAGYSEGATRAESLARRHPDRYRRVVLAGAPRAPKSPIPGVRTAIVAGALDRRAYLEEAARELERRGADVAFFVLPGARHGEYGPEAERVMREAFDWVATDR